jgi:hypothetical protein
MSECMASRTLMQCRRTALPRGAEFHVFFKVNGNAYNVWKGLIIGSEL